MATRQPSKILSVSEIKAAKTEAATAVKSAQASAKEVSGALATHRKAFAATKAAAVKAHDLAMKALDKDHAAKDKELVKAHLTATKSVEAAQKALDKVAPPVVKATVATPV
jgi:TPP-dependent trihydroxycyclohexane-1,2-dione (THcHDO) dehydratase